MTPKSLLVIFFLFLSAPFSEWTCSSSPAHRGDECLTFISIEKLYALDKIKPGCGMTYLNSYQGFLCCWENTGPWATPGFNILKLYLFYLLSNLSVSVNFLNAT